MHMAPGSRRQTCACPTADRLRVRLIQEYFCFISNMLHIAYIGIRDSGVDVLSYLDHVVMGSIRDLLGIWVAFDHTPFSQKQ